MDARHLSYLYPIGTVVLYTETNELLRITQHDIRSNSVRFSKIKSEEDFGWDFATCLGKFYVKTNIAKVLYERK